MYTGKPWLIQGKHFSTFTRNDMCFFVQCSHYKFLFCSSLLYVFISKLTERSLYEPHALPHARSIQRLYPCSHSSMFRSFIVCSCFFRRHYSLDFRVFVENHIFSQSVSACRTVCTFQRGKKELYVLYINRVSSSSYS